MIEAGDGGGDIEDACCVGCFVSEKKEQGVGITGMSGSSQCTESMLC